MATASRHLCRTLLRISSRPPTRRKCQRIIPSRIQPSPFRQLSTTSYRQADSSQSQSNEDDAVDPENQLPEDELQVPAQPYKPSDLDAEDRAHYETLSKPEQTRYMALQNHFKAISEGEDMSIVDDEEIEQYAADLERNGPLAGENFMEPAPSREALNDAFWALGEEDDDFTQIPDDDDDWDPSMMTSVAESELEVHRETREYTRIAAWDLPLLLQYAKPWTLPDMKKQPLRFRYTTYMGETHPAQNKVVVEFTTKDLASATSLSEAQRTKLIKLVGVRYNPDRDSVRISCENFENAAQNKRYLGDLVQKLVKEAKDSTDTFEDVPLDFRHHKPRKIANFPDSWKIDGQQGVQSLTERRGATKLLEEGEMATAQQQKKPVDGREMVAMYVAAKSMMPQAQRSNAMMR